MKSAHSLSNTQNCVHKEKILKRVCNTAKNSITLSKLSIPQNCEKQFNVLTTHSFVHLKTNNVFFNKVLTCAFIENNLFVFLEVEKALLYQIWSHML